VKILQKVLGGLLFLTHTVYCGDFWRGHAIVLIRLVENVAKFYLIVNNSYGMLKLYYAILPPRIKSHYVPPSVCLSHAISVTVLTKLKNWKSMVNNRWNLQLILQLSGRQVEGQDLKRTSQSVWKNTDIGYVHHIHNSPSMADSNYTVCQKTSTFLCFK